VTGPEDEAVITYGGAKPGDANFADIVAIDSDIISLLASVVPPIIGFNDNQLEMVLIAAAALPHARRDGFLRAVASRLDGDEIDDGRPAARHQ
jgi:hypothetical protein